MRIALGSLSLGSQLIVVRDGNDDVCNCIDEGLWAAEGGDGEQGHLCGSVQHDQHLHLWLIDGHRAQIAGLDLHTYRSEFCAVEKGIEGTERNYPRQANWDPRLRDQIHFPIMISVPVM